MKKILSVAIVLSLILSMSLWSVGFAADEVLINDSFENGIDEWTYTNDYAKSHIKADTSTASDGKTSLLFDDDTDTTSPIFKSKYMDSKEGDVFVISADIKLLEGAAVSVFYKFYDASNKQLTGSGSVASKATEWTNASKTVTAPAGTVKLQLWITGSIKTLGKCYVDNVKVVRTAGGSGSAATATPSTTPSTTTPSKPAATVTRDGDALFSDDFENGLSNWTFANSYAETNIKISQEQANDGKSSVHLIDDASDKSPIIKSPMIPVNVGDTYMVSAYFKKVSGTAFKVWVKFFDANNKQIFNGSFAPTSTEWTYQENMYTAPEGAVNVQVWLTGNNKNVGESYIDGIKIIKPSTAAIEEMKKGQLDPPKVIDGIPADSDKFHIYLCIGQSNMVGADTIPQSDFIVVDGAYLYNKDSKWEVAQPYPVNGPTGEYMGYNRYSTVSPGSGRMGPTIGFSRGMAAKVPAGVKIGIISNAIGGTTIEQWSKGFEATSTRPDKDLYESAVARTKEALAKGGVLKGIIWLQGESCASKAGYMEKLVKVANGLREEIGVKNSDVPFIVSEVPQIRPACVATLRTAPQHIENSYVISTEGLTIFDSIHFDVDSQRKLGLRMAETVLDKVYGIKASADDMYNEIYKGVQQPQTQPDNIQYTILINGNKLTMDVQPINAGGRLFVPLRAIFEALNATVNWDDATKTVTGIRGDRTVIMTIGDENVYVNGQQISMGLAPMIVESRTLVPVRFVSEGLGATVDWNDATKTASITLK